MLTYLWGVPLIGPGRNVVAQLRICLTALSRTLMLRGHFVRSIPRVKKKREITQRAYNMGMVSCWRRCDIASTSIRRHSGTICPLGTYLCFKTHEISLQSCKCFVLYSKQSIHTVYITEMGR